MPIMIDNLSAISPTITLAELFENQKHYLAAYAIYRFLSIHNSDLEISDKLKSLRTKAFTNGHKTDNPQLLSYIFDEEEYFQLGILCDERFSLVKQALDILLDKDTCELDIIETQDEHLYSDLEDRISSEWQEILSTEKDEKAKMKAESISLDNIDWSNIKLSDFIQFLVNLKCDDRTLDKLKLAEIMELFFSHYSQIKNNDED